MIRFVIQSTFRPSRSGSRATRASSASPHSVTRSFVTSSAPRRACGCRRPPLPDVLGSLRDAVLRTAGAVEDLAGAAPDLASHEEGDQDVGHARELAVARDEVVLMASVGVAGRVRVVLEQVDL